MSVRSLSAVGQMALRTEKESNLSILGMVLLFEGEITRDEVESMIEERVIPKYSRFSSKVEKEKFVLIPDFDFSPHIYNIEVPDGQGNEKSLSGILSPFQNQRLDENKPLWSLGVAYLPEDNITALYWRLHHCIGDGVSMVILVNSFCDQYWGKELRDHVTKKPGGNIGHIVKRILQFCMFLIGTLLVFLHWAICSFRMLGTTSTPRILKPSHVSTKKLIAWDRHIISLNKAKEIISCIEGEYIIRRHITINDLMLSCMTQALRRYLKETYGKDASYLPAVVPVNLRPTATTLGNKIGSMSFLLPMDIDDPITRVTDISNITSSGKRLPEAYVTYGMTKLFTHTPHFITKAVFNVLSSQVYCIMSNVRGSSQPLSYNGHALRGIVGFVPPPNGVTLGIGLASYQDWLGCTINCDKTIIPHPETIIKYYKEEFFLLVDKFELTQKRE